MSDLDKGKIAGRGVVVTGAGHGIGRALAERAASEGARVVVNDLDARAATEVARQIGGEAVAGDCASEAGVEGLIAAATAKLGRIDIYFANAGIDRTASDSLLTSDGDWGQMLETNLMSHVRAARLLIPRWLQDGVGGRFVVTASAAGLLSQIGGAPYAVTKHASVAFAEWLSITYGDRSVVVQAICPQSVQTRMLENAGPAKDLLPDDRTLSPEQVAETWMRSLVDDHFLVLPHAEVADYYASRATDTDRWLRGMRRLQGKLSASR